MGENYLPIDENVFIDYENYEILLNPKYSFFRFDLKDSENSNKIYTIIPYTLEEYEKYT